MNFNKHIKPFTEAVMLTEGKSLPTEPILLNIKSRRFIWDMIMSKIYDDAIFNGVIEPGRTVVGEYTALTVANPVKFAWETKTPEEIFADIKTAQAIMNGWPLV